MTKKNEEEKQKKQPPVKEEDATESDVPEAEKLAALAEDYKRKWYSVSAEYDNYRKRNASELLPRRTARSLPLPRRFRRTANPPRLRFLQRPATTVSN